MNAQTPFGRPLARDHVSGTSPLRPKQLRGTRRAALLPPDMATHVTTTPRRVLAVAVFIILCHVQVRLYIDVLTPMWNGAW